MCTRPIFFFKSRHTRLIASILMKYIEIFSSSPFSIGTGDDTGISRSGRVRKKSSKYSLDFESLEEGQREMHAKKKDPSERLGFKGDGIHGRLRTSSASEDVRIIYLDW